VKVITYDPEDIFKGRYNFANGQSSQQTALSYIQMMGNIENMIEN
jgi:hypothetical protein